MFQPASTPEDKKQRPPTDLHSLQKYAEVEYETDNEPPPVKIILLEDIEGNKVKFFLQGCWLLNKKIRDLFVFPASFYSSAFFFFAIRILNRYMFVIPNFKIRNRAVIESFPDFEVVILNTPCHEFTTFSLFIPLFSRNVAGMVKLYQQKMLQH